MSRSWFSVGLGAGISLLQIAVAFLCALAPCGWSLTLYSIVGTVVVLWCTCLPLWWRAGGTPNQRFGLAGLIGTMAAVAWWIGLEAADIGLACGA